VAQSLPPFEVIPFPSSPLGDQGVLSFSPIVKRVMALSFFFVAAAKRRTPTLCPGDLSLMTSFFFLVQCRGASLPSTPNPSPDCYSSTIPLCSSRMRVFDLFKLFFRPISPPPSQRNARNAADFLETFSSQFLTSYPIKAQSCPEHPAPFQGPPPQRFFLKIQRSFFPFYAAIRRARPLPFLLASCLF